MSELSDVGSLIKGGELILTTGIALPPGREALQHYVSNLDSAGASGIVLELGRRFRELPSSIIEVAAERHMPMVTLGREVRFVQVTEEILTRVVSVQFAELRASQQAHEAFTELSLHGAPAALILRQLSQMAGAPAVFENLTHQVLAYATAGHPPDDVLQDWEHRSRSVDGEHPTEQSTRHWQTSLVGARDLRWGRLILLLDEPVTRYQRMALERAAAAIAINRLAERDGETLERLAHRDLLSDIVSHDYSSSAQIFVRAKAVGVTLARRDLVPIEIRFDANPTLDEVAQQARRRACVNHIAASARDLGLDAIVGPLNGAVGVILALPPEAELADVLTRFARAAHRATARSGASESIIIGVGSPTSQLADIARGLRDTRLITEAAPYGSSDCLYFTIRDVRIRGLLHVLRGNERLQAFVERELAPLVAHDSQQGTRLREILAAYLECGLNKTAAANAVNLSRPAFYQRLALIEDILQVDLESVQTCLSLHVAMLSLDSIRMSPSGEDEAAHAHRTTE